MLKDLNIGVVLATKDLQKAKEFGLKTPTVIY
jgi:hypothetical protein